MKRTVLSLCVCVVVLAGCGKSEQEQAALPAAVVAPAVEPSAPVAKPAGDAILIDGYRPTFAHKVASQRHTDLGDGRTEHVVIVGANGADQARVVEVLAADAKQNGLALNEIASVDKKSRRFTLRNASSSAMMAVVSPQDDNGKTVVYFGWKDGSAAVQ